MAIIKAIGTGNHSLSDISNAALVGKAHLSAYLARLREIRLVERRLPITIPRLRRRRARTGRYHLTDPYFRFYFRFITPYQDELAYKPERVLPRIQDRLRSFVGSTAFEELARQWIATQGQAGNLSFEIDEVGTHWSRAVQVDVIAVNWTEHKILLGECKWGTDPINRGVIRELIENRTPKVTKYLSPKGDVWQVHYVFFGRAGFTDAARNTAEEVGAELVDLTRLDSDLLQTN